MYAAAAPPRSTPSGDSCWSHTGRVLWCMPQAARLLGKAFRDFDTEGYVLPGNVRAHHRFARNG